MSGLVLPNGGKMELAVEHLPAPLANAVGFALTLSGRPQLFVVGGMSPLLAITAQIAAGLSSNPDFQGTSGELAALAKERAAAILAACAGPDPE